MGTAGFSSVRKARDESIWVADRCEALGLTHSTLRWRGWDGSGNLQDQARRARYRLLTEWAQACGIGEVALGHTAAALRAIEPVHPEFDRLDEFGLLLLRHGQVIHY